MAGAMARFSIKHALYTNVEPHTDALIQFQAEDVYHAQRYVSITVKELIKEKATLQTHVFCEWGGACSLEH